MTEHAVLAQGIDTIIRLLIYTDILLGVIMAILWLAFNQSDKK